MQYTIKNLIFLITSLLLLSACESMSLEQQQEISSEKKQVVLTKRKVTAVDFLEIEKVNSAQLSPDGKIFFYVKENVDWAKNKYTKQMVFLDLLADSELKVSNPKLKSGHFEKILWAPDSQGFLSYFKEDVDAESANVKGKDKNKNKKIKSVKQVYYYSLVSKTLRQVTNFSKYSSSISNLKWSPNGEGFYYTTKQANALEKSWLYEKAWALKEYENRAGNELHYFSLGNNNTEVLIAGDFSVSSYSLSADGEYILYRKSPNALSDSRHSADLYLYNIASQESISVTNNAYAENAAKLSPDNKFLAYIATVNEQGEAYYEDNLFIQDLDSNTPQLLLPDMHIEVANFAWSKNGQDIFIRGNIGLSSDIFQYNIATKKLKNLTGPKQHNITAWSYNPDLDTHTVKISHANSPGEYFLFESSQPDTRQVTDVHDDLKDMFFLPEQRAYQWTASDGTVLEGLLVLPTKHQDGKTFPLVTITHGGPRSAVHYGAWNSSRYVTVLANQGYAVFLPNHRGGTGYGDEFMRSMVGNYWRHAHTDVLSGIDSLVADGLVNPNALVKQGWSAGGHMTNKLISFTKRFKAAASGAGASDWVSMYGESDVRYGRTPWFGGTPWKKNAPLDNYREQSVFKDAWKVATPTLFWVGEKDVRVPPTQSILMYRAVKANGVNAELYIAPGEPHNYRKPRHKLFKINKELEWYARYLDDMHYTPVLPQYAIDNKPKNKNNYELN